MSTQQKTKAGGLFLYVAFIYYIILILFFHVSTDNTAKQATQIYLSLQH